MGQAKARGTYLERVAQSVEKEAAADIERGKQREIERFQLTQWRIDHPVAAANQKRRRTQTRIMIAGVLAMALA